LKHKHCCNQIKSYAQQANGWKTKDSGIKAKESMTERQKHYV